ncbi:MAG: phosphoribosylglycinamide formyltransferase [Ignavibacterium sp.]|nr:phosphoribosylglycinamide formyltransferase [Ignavibacterium sp.]
MQIAVFVSGRGSNLKTILEHEKLKDLIRVRLVCSDKPDCLAIKIAQEYKIDVRILPKCFDDKSIDELLNTLKEFDIELIVLAGFLKLIPYKLIENYKNKIINIHPALLPSFGGKGMFGMNVHKAVFEASVKVSGATVHFVNEEYDKGLIIAQRCVDISDSNSPEEIASKVLEIEHQLLPEVLLKFAENKIKIINGRVFIIK